MIQASGQQGNGDRFILIGLSRENCTRLLDGQPIVVDLNAHGAKAALTIVGGETEADIEREIRQNFNVGSPS